MLQSGVVLVVAIASVEVAMVTVESSSSRE